MPESLSESHEKACYTVHLTNLRVGWHAANPTVVDNILRTWYKWVQ